MTSVKSKMTSVQKVTGIFSVMLAIASMEHGFFEVLQGFQRTTGYIFQAIGKDIRWWEGGTEEAFSILPNYAGTGMIAMAISLIIIIWSFKFLTHEYSPLIYLGLFITVTLFGGGIGHTPFFLLVFIYSILNWNKKTGDSKDVKDVWMVPSALAVALWLLAVEIAVFGFFPYVTGTETLYMICWGSLGVAFLCMNAAYIAAIITDKKRPKIAST